MVKKTIWRAVADALDKEGTDYVFGLPGNPKHLVYDLTEHTPVKFVLVRDEKSAVSCAYAYARLKRKPGVVFSNPGPGITSLVTGMLEANIGLAARYCDRQWRRGIAQRHGRVSGTRCGRLDAARHKVGSPDHRSEENIVDH